jgi:hypothetical protein
MPRMTNEPKDRHVLVAAVASSTGAVVTFNLRHFPADACESFDVAGAVVAAIRAQAAALRRPPVSAAELIAMLERAGVPDFAARLRLQRFENTISLVE